MGAHRAQAVRLAGGHGAGAAGAIPAQFAAMWMGLRGHRRVAEHVVGEAEPGAQAFG